MSVHVDAARCPQNHACPALRHCPVGAITQDGFSAPTVDAGLCVDCGRCQLVCPHGVFVGEAAG